MTVLEPPEKKSKTNVSDINLEAILSKDITEPVPLVPVLTATVKNKKLTLCKVGIERAVYIAILD